MSGLLPIYAPILLMGTSKKASSFAAQMSAERSSLGMDGNKEPRREGKGPSARCCWARHHIHRGTGRLPGRPRGRHRKATSLPTFSLGWDSSPQHVWFQSSPISSQLQYQACFWCCEFLTDTQGEDLGRWQQRLLKVKPEAPCILLSIKCGHYFHKTKE